MNAQKRMGKKGTLTIPQHLRHQLGFRGGTALDITATRDGGLLLPEAPGHLQHLQWHL